jgi:hypothetical protein
VTLAEGESQPESKVTPAEGESRRQPDRESDRARSAAKWPRLLRPIRQPSIRELCVSCFEYTTARLANGCKIFGRTPCISLLGRALLPHAVLVLPKDYSISAGKILPLLRVFTARRRDGAGRKAFGLVSFQDPGGGAARSMQRHFGEPILAQLQAGSFPSEIDRHAIFLQAIGRDACGLNQPIVANRNPDRNFGLDESAKKSAEIVLGQEADISLAKCGWAFDAGLRTQLTGMCYGGIRHMIHFDPPAKGVEIGARCQEDFVNHLAVGIQKLDPVGPVSRVLFHGDKSTRPTRKGKLQVAIAATRALAARRGQHVRIGALGANGRTTISAEPNHAAKRLDSAKEHRPARQEGNQRTPPGHMDTRRSCRGQYGIAGEGSAFNRRALALRNARIHGAYHSERETPCLTVSCQKFAAACAGLKLDL